MIKKNIILLIILSVILAGCINIEKADINVQTEKSEQSEQTQKSPIPTVSQTIYKQPKETKSEQTRTTEITKENYDSIFKDKIFLPVSGQQIISGTVNGEYVNFIGNVFNVLPRHVNNIYGKDFVNFQVWGNPISQEGPIYITVPIDRVNGLIRDGIIISISGYVNKDWMEGKNSYGGPVSQPLIFAINVTVIPESPD